MVWEALTAETVTYIMNCFSKKRERGRGEGRRESERGKEKKEERVREVESRKILSV